jgi:hypothetical protein
MPLLVARSNSDRPALVRRKRLDGRTKAARETKRLIAQYSRQLGMTARNSGVRAEIVRLAETEVVISDRRAAVLRGELVDLAAVVRLQNIAIRLRRALRLDVRKSEPADLGADAEMAAIFSGDSHGD